MGVGGVTATEVIDGRKRFPVVVRLAEAYRDTPEAIGRLLLTSPSGARVDAVAGRDGAESSTGPELINHENGERMVIVQSNVRGRDLGGFAADVQREVGRRVVCPRAISSPTAASSRISSARCAGCRSSCPPCCW